jgi:hypothetical protein
MSLPPTLLAQVQYDVDPKLSSDGFSPVPDVDKPNLADQSCWLAAAANVLGGAGWGVGANPQAKAVNIYNNLMTHFGNGAMLGWSSIAINWWLLNHGYNPNSPDYNPNLTYNNVTIIRPPQGFVNLTMPQYDGLLNQISACQYVNVSFDPPSPGHEMTLVGGNFSNTLKPAGSVSLWHDNNGDLVAGTDTEVDPNMPPANNTWFINHRNIPQFYGAKIATVLCPGLQKPDAAMQNFDIAWFKDMKQVGGNDVLFNAQRVAGNKAGQYHGPGGGTDLEWAGTTLQPEAIIPNQWMPEPWYKEVYLLVDYIDQNVLVAFPGIANITLKVGNIIYNPVVTWDDNNNKGQALYYWKLDAEDGQPQWESIVFPDPSYMNLYDISTGLGGPVKDWNVATICSPEPATLMLLAVGGGLALLRRRRTAA